MSTPTEREHLSSLVGQTLLTPGPAALADN